MTRPEDGEPLRRAQGLGQSGAEISIIDRAGVTAVRKSASAESGRARLAAQADKHAEAHQRLAGTSVHVPRILDDWDGWSYVMEYVPSIPLGTYVATASPRNVASVVQATVGVLGAELDASSRERSALDDTRTALVAKLRSLSPRLAAEAATDRGQAHALVARSTRMLVARAPGLTIPHGWHHGDFSFENLLVNARTAEVSAIDFLDSPVETPLVDIGRILLDSEHGWWVSSGSRASSEILASRVLARSVRELAAAQGIGPLEISAFKMLAALRVLPYTRTPLRRATLLNALKAGLATMEDGTT